MTNTVKGSARKGMRDTHGKRSMPTNLPPENSVPGGTPGGGDGKGAENVHGSAGNAQKSGTPGGAGGESGAMAGRSTSSRGRGPDSFTS